MRSPAKCRVHSRYRLDKAPENYCKRCWDIWHARDHFKEYVKQRYAPGVVAGVGVENRASELIVSIYSAQTGAVKGRKGAEIQKLLCELSQMACQRVRVEIQEVKSPETHPQLIAETIVQKVTAGASLHFSTQKSLYTAMDFGATGIKLCVSSPQIGTRLYQEGYIPLAYKRTADNYGAAESPVSNGLLRVLCWIYKGMVPLWFSAK